MATAKRVIEIDVRTNSESKQAIQVLNKRLRSIETSSQKAAKSLKKVERNFNTAAVAAKLFGAAFALARVTRFSDSLTNISSRLSLVLDETISLESAMDDLFKSADRTRSTFDATGDLYVRLAQSTKELGITHEDLVKATGGLSASLRISGATAQEAKSSMIQFGQAMSSSVLAGDEFRSVSEGNVVLMNALGKALGKTRGELREMSKKGLLGSANVMKILIGVSDELITKVEDMPLTFQDAFNKIINASYKVLNAMAPAFEQMAEMIAGAVDGIKFIEGAAKGIAINVGGAIENPTLNYEADLKRYTSEQETILRHLEKRNRQFEEGNQKRKDNLIPYLTDLEGRLAAVNSKIETTQELLDKIREPKAKGSALEKLVPPPLIKLDEPEEKKTSSKTTAALKEVVTWQDNYRNSLVATQTEIDRFSEYVSILDNLYFDGVIGLETYTAELEKLTGVLSENTVPEIENFSEEMRTAIAGSVVDSIGKMTDAFVDFALTGEQSFRQMTSSILANMAKMILKMIVLNQLKSVLANTPFAGLVGPVPSYATGTPYVPNTGLALLHKGERVVPANQNTITNNNTTERPINVMNIVDPNMIKDAMSGSAGEEMIFNVIRNNPELTRQLVSA